MNNATSEPTAIATPARLRTPTAAFPRRLPSIRSSGSNRPKPTTPALIALSRNRVPIVGTVE
jgi:hypothetical protein